MSSMTCPECGTQFDYNENVGEYCPSCDWEGTDDDKGVD